MEAFLQFLLSLLGPVEGIVRSVVQVAVQVGMLALRPFAWAASKLGAFTSRWMASRNQVWLIQGMPAFLIAIAVGATTLAAWLPTRRDIAINYLLRAQESFEEGDQATAGLYIEKAARALHRSDASEYQRALVMGQMGRTKEANQLLMDLAPTDRVGHVPAHLKVIDRLLADTENPRAEELIKVHTSLVLQDNPGHARVHRLLAFKAIQDKQLHAALEHLDFAVEKFERLRLPYAQLLRVAGKLDKSNDQAEKLVKWFEERVKNASIKKLKGEVVKPKDETTVQDYVAYSATLSLLKRYSDSVGILITGLNELTEKEITEDEEKKYKYEVKTLRSALANTYLTWSDTYSSDNLADMTQKMIQLDKALRLAPDSPAVLSRVAQIATLKGRPAETANERLRQILANAKAPAVVHFILGTSAAEKQDTETALFHLEQASRINPNVPVTLNNLAWVLSHETGAKDDPEKLARAKQLSDKAVKFRPKNAQFRETRGQIALLQGQWPDAIADLEFALQKVKTGQVPIHESLAVAYTGMQNPKMARLHKKLAKSRANGDSAVDAFESKETNSENDSRSAIADLVNGKLPDGKLPNEKLPIGQPPETKTAGIPTQASTKPAKENSTKENPAEEKPAKDSSVVVKQRPDDNATKTDVQKPPAVVTNNNATPDKGETALPDLKPEMRIGPAVITGPVNDSTIRPVKLTSGNSKATSQLKVEELPGPQDDDESSEKKQKSIVEEIPPPEND